jgi:hypothetical protein
MNEGLGRYDIICLAARSGEYRRAEVAEKSYLNTAIGMPGMIASKRKWVFIWKK